MNEFEIMDKFQKFHSKHKLQHIKKFHGKLRSIPYSYCLLKDKDITRIRPIVSYYNHPLKECYNYASRALAKIIKHSETNHFTLWKTQDMKSCIKQIQKDLQQVYGKNTNFSILCGDIKNMYTELPHDEIIKAVEFMINRTKAKTRRKHVTIERKKRGEINLGKTSAVTSESHTVLSFEKILEICKFDIKNTYFTSLGQILHQTKGVPMGSPGSPIYAICICAYYEHLLHKKLKNFEDSGLDVTNRVRGLRYIDDLITFIAWDRNDPQGKDIVTDIEETIALETYHPDMKLKLEDTSKKFSFLEGIIYMKKTQTQPNKIKIKYNNKNFPHLIQTGNIKYHTLQHRGSFITKQQAYAKIIGQLYRIQRTVFSNKKTIKGILEWVEIAQKLHYTKSEILTAMEKMAKKNPKPWAIIFIHFKKYWKLKRAEKGS